jgi:hypothetical protein
VTPKECCVGKYDRIAYILIPILTVVQLQGAMKVPVMWRHLGLRYMISMSAMLLESR